MSALRPTTARESSDSAFDRLAMTRAHELAARGLETTHPNPRVGCVVARGTHIVGEGWHAYAGEPHAEVLALEAAGAAARGATAYVTLEPCAHHGRTPPCVDALIAAGIARVVFAVGDPHPAVDGKGAAALRAAGIGVEAGLMQKEARELNPGFFMRHERGRPFVRVKLAASLDGRTALAGGESRWITGEAARADVQRWRARSSAVMTGIGTVLADDPRLDVREPAGVRRQPLRVVLDTELRTPAHARLLAAPGEVIVMTCSRDASRHAALAAKGVRIVPIVAAGATPAARVDLAAALAALAQLEVNELLVEAGPALAGAFIEAALVDELLLYVAPVLLGPQGRPLAALSEPRSLTDAPRFTIVEQAAVGEDVRLRLRPRARD